MTPFCDRCHDGAAKHMLPCRECGTRLTTSWRLAGSKINDLQQQSIAELVKCCKASHFVDVYVRINGKWEVYQADWIKHMAPLQTAEGDEPKDSGPSIERGDSEVLSPPHTPRRRRRRHTII